MNFKFNQTKKAELKKLISLIVEMYDPDRIVLFGSQARGDWNQESDFDIFVVDCNIKRPMGEVNSAAYRANIELQFDCLKTTSADMLKFKNSTNHVLAHAQREGVDIYNKKENITIEY